jgi:hypothetical protein
MKKIQRDTAETPLNKCGGVGPWICLFKYILPSLPCSRKHITENERLYYSFFDYLRAQGRFTKREYDLLWSLAIFYTLQVSINLLLCNITGFFRLLFFILHFFLEVILRFSMIRLLTPRQNCKHSGKLKKLN